MILVDAERLVASRPNRPLFSDLSLTVSTGDRLGIVGINGCGKSTLMRILVGEIDPEGGVVRRGRGARIGWLPQAPLLPAGSVRNATGEGWEAEAMLDRLGMAGLADADTTTLSGGQTKRVALARLLANEHDLLVLDEPTNHLDLDAIAFLEDRLAAFPGGLILVTHDRHVLDRVTNRVLELDRGTGYLHIPEGWTAGSGYAAYLAGRAEREEQAANAEASRKILARRELAWLRRGAPARTRKPKARIDAATAIVEGKAAAPARAGSLNLGLGTSRLGSKGVEITDVSFSWPDGTPVLKRIDHLFEPGDRLGIVGANGAGKSTLLDLIAGRLTPSAGTIDRGATVKIGYYDQLGRQLDLDQRVREAVAGPHQAEPSREQVVLMERFWFNDDAQFAPIGTLSGGERRRLQLLLTLVEQPNVLLLDEPTNDLDLDTLRAIEDFLEDWAGAMVVVSHDRAFLERTVDEVIALDGEGGAREIRGGVAGWLAERAGAKQGGPLKAQPARAEARAAASTVAPSRGTPIGPRATMRSPSTLRRLIGQAEREMADAAAHRDVLVARLGQVAADHVKLTAVGALLAVAHERVASTEEAWMALAGEAEALGLDI